MAKTPKNAKESAIFDRLQDPKLMAEKYMSLGSILRRKTTKKCDDNLAPEELTADSDEEDVTSSSDE